MMACSLHLTLFHSSPSFTLVIVVHIFPVSLCAFTSHEKQQCLRENHHSILLNLLRKSSHYTPDWWSCFFWWASVTLPHQCIHHAGHAMLFHRNHSPGDLSHPLSCAGGGVGPCGLIYRHQWRAIWVQPHCSHDFHQRRDFLSLQYSTGDANSSISATRHAETLLGSSPCNHGNRRILLVGSSQ